MRCAVVGHVEWVQFARVPRIPRPGRAANPARAGALPALPVLDIPALKAAGSDPAAWIKPAGKPLTFRMTGQSREITLAPLNSLFNTRYVVYWTVA